MSSYNYSYNVLINRFEAFAAGHLLIKRFTHGQIDLSDQLNDDQYPFMHVTPDTIEPTKGAIQFGFHIMFADIPRDKEYKAEYQREVISDCVRLGQDLIAEIQNGLELFGFNVQLVNDVVFEPFMEEQKNTVTGVAFTVKLEVPWDWSACDIPAVWAVGGASSGGSGTPIGILLQVNNVDNAVQSQLDLVAGTNVTLTDNGDGSVTIDATGGGGSGTVTSVALTAPAAFTVTGSPITTAGTLALTAAGNNTQYIDGSGALQSFPAIPVAQGLQDVIDTDAVLTQDNTIDCDTFELTIADTTNFSVDSTNKVNINVNTTCELAIDTSSVSLVRTNGATQTIVIVDNNRATIGASASGATTSVNAYANELRIVTPNVNNTSAVVGQVLTLANSGTGEVEYSTISGLPPSGAAGGDLQGTYPNPTVHRVHGVDLQSGTPTAGDVWVYDGSPAKWQHQMLHASQVDNDSAVTGTHVDDALDHLSTTKVEANAAITAATKTKITYDSKGLVTSGADIVASDVSDSTTVGRNLLKLTNPSAISYLRVNADNTVTAISLATLKSELGIGSAVVATNQTNVGTAFEDVTSLSFAVTANKTYKWRATISYAVTTGVSMFSTNGPATSLNNARFTIATTATANTISNQAAYDAGTNVAFSGNGLATADGIFRVTANGTWTIRFRNSVAASLTVRAGSILEYEEVL